GAQQEASQSAILPEVEALGRSTPVDWVASERSYPLWLRPQRSSTGGPWAGWCGRHVPSPAMLLSLLRDGKLTESGGDCRDVDLPNTAPVQMVESWGLRGARPDEFEAIVSDGVANDQAVGAGNEAATGGCASSPAGALQRASEVVHQLALDFSPRLSG